MSYELPDPHRDEDDCGCRSSATCARHLEEADLTLEHVPMGKQTEDVAADSSAGFVPAFASSVLRPGSVLVERYEYRTKNDKPRAQWCVHRVEGDGSLSQIMVCDSRREALMWAAENV